MPAVPSRRRVVHLRRVAARGRHQSHGNPACGLLNGRNRWPSSDVTTTTNPAAVTCRRPGCAR